MIFWLLGLCKEMRSKADLGTSWKARELSRASLQEKAGLQPAIDPPRAQLLRGYRSQVTLMNDVGGGSYWWLAWWPMKTKVCRHLFQSGP